MWKCFLAFSLIVLLATLMVSLWAHVGPHLALFRDPAHLREWVREWGKWAPVAIIILQVVQVVAAPIPGTAIGLVSGYLFGALWGTVYSMAGTALGSWIAFMLARRYGRPLVERLVPADILARLDVGARRKGLFFFVLVFLLPFLPDDMACFVAGLTPIPISVLMLAVLVGRPPGILVSCWLGAKATALTQAQQAMLIAISGLLALVFLVYGERLQGYALQWTERFTKSC
jgi:uncharacterized membrane protein YdjX (TVP38/TMEM64 family)